MLFRVEPLTIMAENMRELFKAVLEIIIYGNGLTQGYSAAGDSKRSAPAANDSQNYLGEESVK